METLIYKLIYENWQRKAVALATAIIIWLFVNQSIIETKTIPNIPVRIVNLPVEKTIIGLLPNGILSRRITLTLSGSKDVIEELEPGDIEVLIDASTADNEDWVVQISRKNLVSLNPSINLSEHITDVKHTEFVIKVSQLVTAKVPINILPPRGEPPPGYEYLDISPNRLMQTLSGPEESMALLKAQGLDLEFDLSEITKSDLDRLKNPHSPLHDDEISYQIPNKWKQVAIPFHNNAREEINDPEAQNMHIDFLRKEFHPIGQNLIVQVYYPEKYSAEINPKTYSLAIENPIQEKNGIPILAMPLYVHDVSQLFLDIIRDNMEIAIVAAPKSEREILKWSVAIIAPHELEDLYVAYLFANSPVSQSQQNVYSKQEEEILRKRFREYLQRVILYASPDKRLKLRSRLEDNKIHVTVF